LLQIRPVVAAPALVADIGGSTSRFALAESGLRPRHIVTIANDTVDCLEAAIDQYLGQIAEMPASAVLAVAGPVDGDEIALTNRVWRFRLSDLRDRFGFAQVRAINDFEALAWALLGLAPTETRPLGRHSEERRGAKVVLGPGTGLGVAALVPAGKNSWQVVASEGGHMSFGPASENEEPVFARLRAECGPVSAETVLCGRGLIRLHLALHPGTQPLTSEDIIAQAKAGDAAALATTAMFTRLLGRFAGDVAVIFKAIAGVYITGGVANGLAAVLDEAVFRAAFEAHPPYQKTLAATPTRLLTCPEPGLLGCAALVEQMIDADYAG
jgi:glucokinase